MRTITIALAAAISLAAGAALADVIDGDWCAPDNAHHLFIKGPFIITPGGASLSGDYTRHSFSYVVPPGEPQTGETVFMRLLNEQTVSVWVGQDGTPAVWRRCTPIS